MHRDNDVIHMVKQTNMQSESGVTRCREEVLSKLSASSESTDTFTDTSHFLALQVVDCQ